MTKSVEGAVNLLELKPARTIASAANPDGTVVLLVPKFQGAFASRWILPSLAKANYRLKLDAHGSYFWMECDGASTVRAIAEKMCEHFGEELDPMLDRVGTFMRKLDESKFIAIDGSCEAAIVEPHGEASPA